MSEKCQFCKRVVGDADIEFQGKPAHAECMPTETLKGVAAVVASVQAGSSREGQDASDDDTMMSMSVNGGEYTKPISLGKFKEVTNKMATAFKKPTEGAKKITVDVIGEDENPEIYGMMKGIIAAFHPHLATAEIALAWNLNWKEDQDDHLRLGQCRKCGDIDRDLHGKDFVIVLNHEAWNDFDGDQRTALLDHELSHAAVAVDADSGEEKVDERGRLVYRIRKHDVEEFTGIVRRHGLYKSVLEAFYKAASDKRKAPLFNKAGTA